MGGTAMLDIILVAAAMYVCPGDVYTDVPQAGCRPLQESGRESFARDSGGT